MIPDMYCIYEEYTDVQYVSVFIYRLIVKEFKIIITFVILLSLNFQP